MFGQEFDIVLDILDFGPYPADDPVSVVVRHISLSTENFSLPLGKEAPILIISHPYANLTTHTYSCSERAESTHFVLQMTVHSNLPQMTVRSNH